MYYLLGICFCATVVLLVGAAGWLLVVLAAPLLRRVARSWPAPVRAQFLFFVRLLPAAAGLLVTLGIVLPAFLLHEPARTNERLELPLLVPSALGLALVVSFVYRCLRAWVRLDGLRRGWMRSARRLAPDQKGVEIFAVADPGALIVVTGIVKPTVFVSQPVVSSLSESESAAAIAHELAHVAAGDNLKQFLLQATRLPCFDRLAGLDREWRLAAELAADELAIRLGIPVLELASALVKVARLRVGHRLPEGAVSYFLPPGKESMLSTRVEHLQTLLERGGTVQPVSRVTPAHVLGIALLGALLAVVLLHPDLFLLTHKLLEKLV